MDRSSSRHRERQKPLLCLFLKNLKLRKTNKSWCFKKLKHLWNRFNNKLWPHEPYNNELLHWSRNTSCLCPFGSAYECMFHISSDVLRVICFQHIHIIMKPLIDIQHLIQYFYAIMQFWLLQNISSNWLN